MSFEDVSVSYSMKVGHGGRQGGFRDRGEGRKREREREREREMVYSPQYNKYIALNNDSNKTKWRVARKAQEKKSVKNGGVEERKRM